MGHLLWALTAAVLRNRAEAPHHGPHLQPCGFRVYGLGFRAFGIEGLVPWALQVSGLAFTDCCFRV